MRTNICETFRLTAPSASAGLDKPHGSRRGSVWLPCGRKHELTEARKFLKAALAGKPAAFVPYCHKRGASPIATMPREDARKVRDDILSMAERIDVFGLPSMVAAVVWRVRAERMMREAYRPKGPEWFDGERWHTSEDSYRAAVKARKDYRDRPDFHARTHYVNDPAQYDRDYAAALAEYQDRMGARREAA